MVFTCKEHLDLFPVLDGILRQTANGHFQDCMVFTCREHMDLFPVLDDVLRRQQMDISRIVWYSPAESIWIYSQYLMVFSGRQQMDISRIVRYSPAESIWIYSQYYMVFSGRQQMDIEHFQDCMAFTCTEHNGLIPLNCAHPTEPLRRLLAPMYSENTVTRK